MYMYIYIYNYYITICISESKEVMLLVSIMVHISSTAEVHTVVQVYCERLHNVKTEYLSVT